MDAFVLIILAIAGILAFVTTFVAIGWTVEAIAKTTHRHIRSRGRTTSSPDGNGHTHTTRVTDPSGRTATSQPLIPVTAGMRTHHRSPR